MVGCKWRIYRSPWGIMIAFRQTVNYVIGSTEHDDVGVVVGEADDPERDDVAPFAQRTSLLFFQIQQAG